MGRGGKAAPVVAFFDVDGTLMDQGNDDGYEAMPTMRVQEAIPAFVEQGNIAVICAGRSILGVSGLRDMPSSGFVTLNGTHVILGDQVILNHATHADMLSRTLEEMRHVGGGRLAIIRQPVMRQPTVRHPHASMTSGTTRSALR